MAGTARPTWLEVGRKKVLIIFGFGKIIRRWVLPGCLGVWVLFVLCSCRMSADYERNYVGALRGADEVGFLFKEKIRSLSSRSIQGIFARETDQGDGVSWVEYMSLPRPVSTSGRLETGQHVRELAPGEYYFKMSVDYYRDKDHEVRRLFGPVILKQTILGGHIYCVKYVGRDNDRKIIIQDVTAEAEYQDYAREIERK